MQTHNLISIKTLKKSSGKTTDCKKQEFEAIEFSNSSAPLQKGRRVGPYEIERLLGTGGMCKVYLARQLSLNRMVAIKIVEGLADDKEMLEFFNKEIRTTAKINHRNVVTAIEGGIYGENFYLSMNYIDGETLEDIVGRHGPFTEEKASGIMLVMGETLRYLHEKMQVYHKDIKPSNIMIDKSNEVFLLDLGISQYAGEKARDCVLGSPHYMSPEQIMGKNLDWRTDLYSLGATFYFMVFGRPPYNDEDVNIVVEKHLKGVFPIPKEAELRKNVSENCLKIIKKMMSRNRDDRFQDWSSFLSDLKRLQNPGDKELLRTPQDTPSQSSSHESPPPPNKELPHAPQNMPLRSLPPQQKLPLPSADKERLHSPQATPLKPLPLHSRLPLHKELSNSLNAKPSKPLIPLIPLARANPSPSAILPPLIPLKKGLDVKNHNPQEAPSNANAQNPSPVKKIKPLGVVNKDSNVIRH